MLMIVPVSFSPVSFGLGWLRFVWFRSVAFVWLFWLLAIGVVVFVMAEVSGKLMIRSQNFRTRTDSDPLKNGQYHMG